MATLMRLLVMINHEEHGLYGQTYSHI